MSLFDALERNFGSRDLYKVFNIPRSASENDIRKAYYKLSLIYHPDKVATSEKSESADKFKIIGQIYAVLSDPDKRQMYLETGSVGERDELDEDQDWEKFWRNLFQPISIMDIDDYEANYKASNEELNDIKQAYLKCKGDIDKMYQHIPFMCLQEEPRIVACIKKLIDDKELEPFDIFINEPEGKKQRRIRKYKKEEKEANKQAAQSAKRQKLMSQKEGTISLSKAILERRQITSDNFLEELEKKYCKSNEKKDKKDKTKRQGKNT